MRWEYDGLPLNRKELEADPLLLFKSWFQAAKITEGNRANLMTLATMDKNSPDARIVLLKAIDINGLIFFTDKNSPKSKQLKKNSRACLVFSWPNLNRQVRAWCNATTIGKAEASEYFATRPRASQIASSISKQSMEIETRKDLELAYKNFEKQQINKKVSTPEHWGGFYLMPFKWEFWQGRPGRLHDRFLYERKDEKGRWGIKRLQP